jgi:hypothetical protein
MKAILRKDAPLASEENITFIFWSKGSLYGVGGSESSISAVDIDAGGFLKGS